MKKYIWIVTLLTYVGLYSQETIIPLEERYTNELPFSNLYFKDVTGYLNKYIGTWEYSSSSVYLKVKFYKMPHAKGGFGTYEDIFEDELRSYILYKVLENGTWITKYNTFAVALITDDDANSRSIRGNFKTYDDKLSLSYTEPTTHCRRRKAASLDLKVFDENGIGKLKWDRKMPRNNRIGDGVCPDGTLWDESDFIIPANMILTKVN